jgi:hypothetical protein
VTTGGDEKRLRVYKNVQEFIIFALHLYNLKQSCTLSHRQIYCSSLGSKIFSIFYNQRFKQEPKTVSFCGTFSFSLVVIFIFTVAGNPINIFVPVMASETLQSIPRVNHGISSIQLYYTITEVLLPMVSRCNTNPLDSSNFYLLDNH